MLEPPGQVRIISEPAESKEEPGGQPKEDPSKDTAPPPSRKHWWSSWLAITLISSLGVFLYAYTLDYPFQFDDHIYLLGSPFVTEMQQFLFGRSFHEVANHSLSLGLGYDPSVNFILRPVAYLTFHLNYLAGGFSPAGFRAVNIGIHCVNAVLLFLLLTHFLRRSPRAAGLSPGSVLFIPLAAALLFVAHPLHTESVTYIVQRFTSMVGLFVLSSILLHFLSLSAEKRATKLALRICAVAATAAGMLTKESMFTAPLLIVMLHVVVMGGTLKRACWQALPHLLCMLIIPTLVLLTSHAQSSTGHHGGAMQIAVSTKDPAYQFHYFLTQLTVVLEYVKLIIWPHGLNVDREYDLVTSVFEPRVWLSLLAIVAMLAGCYSWQRREGTGIRQALICAAVFWFFLRLAVSSSFVPLDDLMVDHRTYGASMGLLTAVACLLDMIRTCRLQWVGLRWATPAALAASIILLGAATLNRNTVWQSETNLWSDAAMKSPGKARPWDNLGVCHFQNGRPEEAMACLMKAAEINPSYLPAYVKIGCLLNARQIYGEAAEWSRRGLAIDPQSVSLHYNLAAALCGMGHLHEGAASLETVIKLMPTHVAAHSALGQIHQHLRNYPKALRYYQTAASLGPPDPVVTQAINELELLVDKKHVAN